MKIYEIMFLVPDLLKTLHENGIKTEDYKWIGLYRDYLAMKALGHKTGYIVAVLAERYGVCERKVYKVVSLMERDCRSGAAG